MSLPAAKEPEAPGQRSAAQSAKPLCILVIEVNRIAADMLVALLQRSV